MLRLNIEVSYNCMELFIIECDSAIEILVWIIVDDIST